MNLNYRLFQLLLLIWDCHKNANYPIHLNKQTLFFLHSVVSPICFAIAWIWLMTVKWRNEHIWKKKSIMILYVVVCVLYVLSTDFPIWTELKSIILYIIPIYFVQKVLILMVHYTVEWLPSVIIFMIQIIWWLWHDV